MFYLVYKITNTITGNYQDSAQSNNSIITKYNTSGSVLNSINLTTLEASNPVYYDGLSSIQAMFVYNGEEYVITPTGSTMFKINWAISTLTKYNLTNAPASASITGASNIFT